MGEVPSGLRSQLAGEETWATAHANTPSGDGGLEILGFSPDQVRLEMVRAAAASDPRFVVDARELDRPPPSFTVDRPFLWAIRDIPTGLLLFVGRVLDPSAE